MQVKLQNVLYNVQDTFLKSFYKHSNTLVSYGMQYELLYICYKILICVRAYVENVGDIDFNLHDSTSLAVFSSFFVSFFGTPVANCKLQFRQLEKLLQMFFCM